MSDQVKDEIDIEKPLELEYLLGNIQALEDLINVLYINAKSEEQYLFYTLALFTYIAELCKKVSKQSHGLIVESKLDTVHLLCHCFIKCTVGRKQR